MCVFAPHNVLADPPFTQIDLLCCRNVLIYLESEYQQKVLQLFHYALRSTGFLVLGLSEGMGHGSELFTPFDTKHRVYAKKPTNARMPLYELLPFPGRPTSTTLVTRGETEVGSQQEVWAAADRLVLSKYPPPGVVVNAALDILQFRGHVGTYLEPAPGQPSRNLQKMAREGLHLALPSLIRKAQRSNKPARQTGLRVKGLGRTLTVNVEVVPFQVSRRASETYFLVSFHDANPSAAAEPARPGRGAPKRVEAQARAQLQLELDETRENLQAVVEERDNNNEELIAALEELRSGNEEMQSTNEELQTAKEELQSANEELTTLNEELMNRNQELSQVLGNLTNLIDSVRLPIVIVGGNLRVRLFSALAERVLHINFNDIGRHLSELQTRLTLPNLAPLVSAVIQAQRPVDQEMQDQSGNWYLLRVRPFHTLENKVDGAVLTWTDINLLKANLAPSRGGPGYLQALISTVTAPLLLLNAALEVQTANAAFCTLFQLAPEAVEHRPIYSLGDNAFDLPELHELFDHVHGPGPGVLTREFEHDFPRLGWRRLLVTVRHLELGEPVGGFVLVAIDDLTLVHQLTDREQLRQLSSYQHSVREEERSRLSREIHDELGGTLTALKIQLHQLKGRLEPNQSELVNMAGAMSEMIDAEVGNIRRIATSLRPPILDDYGLVAAIEWQAREFERQAKVSVTFRTNVESVIVTNEVGTAAFRIFQEALTNIARHAQATVVEVIVQAQGNMLNLRVRDNGRGLGEAKTDEAETLGLLGMRERAELAGGRITITSRRGQGTTVSLQLPTTAVLPAG
jgi:two-component system CheB/CheR fusion protein